jgi:hypothetical protein
MATTESIPRGLMASPQFICEASYMQIKTDVRLVARLRGGRWVDVLCRVVYEVSWKPELANEPKWCWRLLQIEELG